MPPRPKMDSRRYLPAISVPMRSSSWRPSIEIPRSAKDTWVGPCCPSGPPHPGAPALAGGERDGTYTYHLGRRPGCINNGTGQTAGSITGDNPVEFVGEIAAHL